MTALKTALAACALVVSIALPEAAFAQSRCALPPGAKGEVQAVLSKINSLRAQRGLSPLRLTGALNKAAYGHACQMAATGSWGHGASPKARMRSAGCQAGTTGEAIAKGYKGGDPTFELWLNSPKHKQIMMMSSARYAGLAVVVSADGGTPHWVLNVSSRC
jgi:uncharacterized protein YkwD